MVGKLFEKRKKLKEEIGITLVALIITVIVMLILASVAIASVVDRDGLFSKTRQAVKTYENAVNREDETLINLIGQVDYYLEESKLIVEPLNQIVSINQTYNGETRGSYNNPIIPKGFAPINENGANWGTDEGYKYGLVITDEITAGESTGNEFVWVPVDGTSVIFERQDFGFYWRGNFLDYLEPQTQELTKIKISVMTNGGFYIARFEAGKAEGENLATDGSIRAVSKQGAKVWNEIAWSDSGINNDIAPRNGAVTVARSMYLDTEDNKYGVVSTLIYGIQWDTALKFIESYDIGESGYDIYAIDSTGMGNYIGTGVGDPTDAEPAISGFSETFRQKNIYDMAGNVREWTMENYNTSRVYRGGDYGNSASTIPASYRCHGDVDRTNAYLRLSCCTIYKIIFMTLV